MANWPMLAGDNFGEAVAVNTTRDIPVMGRLDQHTTLANAQVLVRDTYTWSGLYCRVITNTLNVAATMSSWKNLAIGNMSVTIGAGLTGVFQDVVNSDNLVTGDLINHRISSPAGAGSVTLTLIRGLLNSGTNVPILACTNIGAAVSFGLTRFYPLGGAAFYGTTEAYAQYRFRVAATLSNLRVYVSVNSLNNSTTCRTRLAGGPGAQSVSIGAGVTGSFEDAVNTDAVAVGTLVNFEEVTTGTAGSITLTALGVKSASLGRQVMTSDVQGESFSTANGYVVVESELTDTLTELNTQAAAGAALVARNLFAYVFSSATTANTFMRLRVNGVNGNLVVTIGAGLTGIFEDTTNSHILVAADLVNYLVNISGGTLNIVATVLGCQLDQPAAAGRVWSVPVLIQGMGVA